jgi:hypothetical protein
MGKNMKINKKLRLLNPCSDGLEFAAKKQNKSVAKLFVIAGISKRDDGS